MKVRSQRSGRHKLRNFPGQERVVPGGWMHEGQGWGVLECKARESSHWVWWPCTTAPGPGNGFLTREGVGSLVVSWEGAQVWGQPEQGIERAPHIPTHALDFGPWALVVAYLPLLCRGSFLLTLTLNQGGGLGCYGIHSHPRWWETQHATP